MRRRHFFSLPLLLSALAKGKEQVQYPEVIAGTPLRFPRDHGAHPEFRTEWWYITGVVSTANGKSLGIQVTFFRNRPGLQDDNPSRFAPKQLLFAHAAIADASLGRLRHDQRVARAGFGLAEASTENIDVRIGDWRLVHDNGSFRARVVSKAFAYDLTFGVTQPVLLQGRDGFSQKGALPQQASYYYSLPHLKTEGTLTIDGKAERVTGVAWMDHEWSSEIMSESAAGWDWTGINLANGDALMAFRMRDRSGAPLFAGGAYRAADGARQVFSPADIKFVPTKQWRSPRTGATYPVAMRVIAGVHDIELVPLMEDQELDSRASVGAVYWEGAVDATRAGKSVGQGYLELTGYFKPLTL